jgi:hypothetical protein
VGTEKKWAPLMVVVVKPSKGPLDACRRRRALMKKTRPTKTKMTTMPPRTPPIIAPTESFEEDELVVGVDEGAPVRSA